MPNATKTDGTLKRKRTLNEYFGKSGGQMTIDRKEDGLDAVKSPTSKTTNEQPVGLLLQQEFITEDEESSLLAFLDAQQWRTDLARRTMHYGGTYCLMPPRDASPESRKKIERNIIEAPSMPAEIGFVVDRMIEQKLYMASKRPAYCIVNEYRPGQGISAHVENFRFGEPVISLTLAGEDTMRFHEMSAAFDGSVRSGQAAKAPRTGKRHDVVLPRRSIVVLKDDARSKWQHEITRGRKSSKAASWRRVSLTFRVDK